jgi:hypothetical protein
MTQINQDIELYAGDDKEIISTVYDDDGNVVSLSGLTAAQWILKKRAKDVNEILSKTLGSGIVVTSASAGILTTTLNSVDTQTMDPGTYYHELRIKNASSKTGTVLVGTFIINPTEEF